MSYITIRGHWCDIIVLNVHAPTGDKNYGKDSSYEEMKRMFGHSPTST